MSGMRERERERVCVCVYVRERKKRQILSTQLSCLNISSIANIIICITREREKVLT